MNNGASVNTVWAVPIKGGKVVGEGRRHFGMMGMSPGNTFKANGKRFRVVKILSEDEASGKVAIDFGGVS